MFDWADGRKSSFGDFVWRLMTCQCLIFVFMTVEMHFQLMTLEGQFYVNSN